MSREADTPLDWFGIDNYDQTVNGSVSMKVGDSFVVGQITDDDNGHRVTFYRATRAAPGLRVTRETLALALEEATVVGTEDEAVKWADAILAVLRDPA